MSVDTIQPTHNGIEVVGDRYRLIEKICQEENATQWRAYDELLARPVTFTMYSSDHENAAEFLQNAHALSMINHPALARVFDAAEDNGRAYVVSEWVDGTLLSELLADGPLDNSDAAAMVGRIADGIAAAHEAGTGVGGLHPDHIVLTRRGAVIARVATAEANPTEEIRSLGGLLYAALTGQWPLGGRAARLDRPALRSPMLVAGQLRSPRQVRGGVPQDLSVLAMQALQPEHPGGIQSADALAAVLSDRALDSDQLLPFGLEPVSERYTPETKPQRPRWFVPTLVALSVGGLALIGLLVGVLIGAVNGQANSPDQAQSRLDLSKTPSAQGGSPASGGVIKPVAFKVFDPQGDGQEEPAKVPLAFDGKPETGWNTLEYRRTPQFGNLKKGVGVLVDFGASVQARNVAISTTMPGVDLEIRAADVPTGPIDSYRVAGTASSIGQKTTVQLADDAGAHRYWVVWLTKLVPNQQGTFQANLSEVQFLN